MRGRKKRAKRSGYRIENRKPFSLEQSLSIKENAKFNRNLETLLRFQGKTVTPSNMLELAVRIAKEEIQAKDLEKSK